jgi:hypothetical protein
MRYTRKSNVAVASTIRNSDVLVNRFYLKVGVLFANDNNRWYIVIIMIRTQISLTEQDYEAAKREAKKLGISLAELLRRSLRSVLPTDESKPWMRYAGMVETGDPASSQRIDEVVYGPKD